MKTQLRTMAAALLISLWTVPALAVDEVETAAPPATVVPDPGQPQEAAGEEKSLSVTIGGKGAGAAEGESKAHGITITVDGDEDSDSARMTIAGKVVDRVIEDLEKSLKDLPEDVRKDLDADDIRELRDALQDIRDLKKEGRRAESADDGFSEEILPGIVAIVLLFGGPVVIVALVSYNNRRKRQMVHETIDRIIGQGKDVPVELLDALDKGRNGKTMLSRGVVNVALGIGIGGMLYGLGGEEAASLGLIPLCIGLAQLLVWKLEKPGQGATPVS